MNNTIRHRRYGALTRCIATFLIITFSSITILPPGYAQTIGLQLPIPGTMVSQSSAFVPVLLKGMTVYPDDPLQFEFIIDSGNDHLSQKSLKKETDRLVKYFFASMTVPQNDLWVNLSPHEKNRIIPDELSKTELGRDLLAQDYILKQLTATMMYPEEELGKKFWDRIYKQAKDKYGITKIPTDTFNKVWILPERAQVYEYENTVYITDSHLKVMLDSDYLAAQENQSSPGHQVTRSPEIDNGEQKTESGKNPSSVIHHPLSKNSSDLGGEGTRELVKKVITDVILPEIEKEVNTGKNFATIRQIYHSLILAKWYKQTVKDSIMSQVYIDKNKTAGIETGDVQMKEKIYGRYMEAYKKGVFNYIKEDYDELSQTVIPRQYFSGGFVDELEKVEPSDNALLAMRAEVGDEHRAMVKAKPEIASSEQLPPKDAVDQPLAEAASELDSDEAMLTNQDARVSLPILEKDKKYLSKNGLSEELTGLILSQPFAVRHAIIENFMAIKAIFSENFAIKKVDTIEEGIPIGNKTLKEAGLEDYSDVQPELNPERKDIVVKYSLERKINEEKLKQFILSLRGDDADFLLSTEAIRDVIKEKMTAVSEAYVQKMRSFLADKNRDTGKKVKIIGLGSPTHYSAWNDLSLETLKGDLEGFFQDSVDVTIRNTREFKDVQSIIEEIIKDKPEILGFSVQTGSLGLVEEILSELKNNPGFDAEKTLVVFGNQVPTYFPDKILEMYPQGVIVRGEGELALRGLVAHYDSDRDVLFQVPNLVFNDLKADKKAETEIRVVDLETLDYIPSTDSYDDIIKIGGNVQVQASRGCPWGGCAYCTRTSFRYGGIVQIGQNIHSWQGFKPERVLRTLAAVMDHGITEVEFSDDEFIGGRTDEHIERIYKIANGIERLAKERDMKFSFRIFTRPDILYRGGNKDNQNGKMRALFERLKEVGLVKVFIGVEAGNPAQLKRYSRGMKFQDIAVSLEIFQDIGIGLDVGFLMFDPELTLDEMIENIHYFRDHNLMPFNQWPFRPVAVNEGSRLAQKMGDKGALGKSSLQFISYEYRYKDPHIKRIKDIVDEVGAISRNIGYALKVKSKMQFDATKKSGETVNAQHYVEAFGFIFLDLMEELAKRFQNDYTEQDIEEIKERASDRIMDLIINIGEDVKAGRLADHDKFLQNELERLGVNIFGNTNDTDQSSPAMAKEEGVDVKHGDNAMVATVSSQEPKNTSSLETSSVLGNQGSSALDSDQAMVGFIRRFVINGYIEGLFYPDINARTYAYNKLIEAGKEALPLIDAERAKLIQAYLIHKGTTGHSLVFDLIETDNKDVWDLFIRDQVLKEVADKIKGISEGDDEAMLTFTVPGIIDALKREAEDGGSLEREQALSLKLISKGEKVLPHIKKILHIGSFSSPTYKVFQQVLFRLYLEKGIGLKEVMELARTGNHQERLNAVKLMGVYSDLRSLDFMIELLHDPKMRSAVISSFWDYQRFEALERLEKELTDAEKNKHSHILKRLKLAEGIGDDVGPIERSQLIKWREYDAPDQAMVATVSSQEPKNTSALETSSVLGNQGSSALERQGPSELDTDQAMLSMFSKSNQKIASKVYARGSGDLKTFVVLMAWLAFFSLFLPNGVESPPSSFFSTPDAFYNVYDRHFNQKFQNPYYQISPYAGYVSDERLAEGEKNWKKILKALNTAGANAPARINASELLGEMDIDREIAINALKKGLRDKNADVRDASAISLLKLGWRPKTETEEIIFLIAQAEVGNITPDLLKKGKRITPYLIQDLKLSVIDESDHVQRTIRRIRGFFGEKLSVPRSYPDYTISINKNSPRKVAAVILGKLRAEEAVQPLLELLSNSNNLDFEEKSLFEQSLKEVLGVDSIVEQLGYFKNKRAVESLLKELGNFNFKEVEKSLEKLGATKEQKVAGYVLALQSNNKAAAQNAEKKLKELGYQQKESSVVQLLVSAEVGPNLKNAGGMTALMYAARSGDAKTVQILIDAGASIDEQDFFGRTALMYATDLGSAKVVKLLIANGASLELKYSFGFDGTILDYAALEGKIEVVKALIDEGVFINAEDNFGFLALLGAVYNGNDQIVKLLVDSWAGLNQQDDYGDTPLMWAVKRNQVSTVKLLLDERNINISLKNNYGKTAFDIAKEKGNEEIIKLLNAWDRTDYAILFGAGLIFGVFVSFGLWVRTTVFFNLSVFRSNKSLGSRLLAGERLLHKSKNHRKREQIIDAFEGALGDADPQIQDLAISGLRKFGVNDRKRTLDKLVKIASESPKQGDVKAEAASLLIDIASDSPQAKEVIPALIDLWSIKRVKDDLKKLNATPDQWVDFYIKSLQSREREAVEHAIDELVALKAKRAIGPLVARSAEPWYLAKLKVALKELRSTRSERINAYTNAALHSSDIKVATYAIEWLRNANAQKSIHKLFPSYKVELGSDNPADVRSAIKKLVVLKDKRAIKPLIALAADERYFSEVEIALRELGATPDQRVDFYTNYALNSSDIDVVQEAIYGLVKLGYNEASLNTLKKALFDSRYHIEGDYKAILKGGHNIIVKVEDDPREKFRLWHDLVEEYYSSTGLASTFGSGYSAGTIFDLDEIGNLPPEVGHVGESDFEKITVEGWKAVITQGEKVFGSDQAMVASQAAIPLRAQGSKLQAASGKQLLPKGEADQLLVVDKDARGKMPDASELDKGGIDMNDIDVDRQSSTESGTETHTIQFDLDGMEPLLNMDIQGFSPIIIDMIPINSVLPLLGLRPIDKGIKYGREEIEAELAHVKT